MQQTTGALYRPLTIALATATIATLGLSACGGSSGGSTSTATQASTAAAVKAPRAQAGGSTAPGAQSPSTKGSAGAAAGRAGAHSRSAAGSQFRQALGAFAACLRANGIAVPKPNTSGNGPVLSTKGLNTASPKFRAATLKCRGVLVRAFRARSGARPAPPSAQPTG
jgi:hypothetical protein